MSSKILFVFEGERQEEKIAESLQTHIFRDKQHIITCVFKAEIYQLYKQFKAEDGYLDIVSLIKERDVSLANYTRTDFAEIYLFFDYDGQSILTDRDGDAELKDMLSIFDDESENGKLYISYPMIEALRHINDCDEFYKLTAKCKGKNCSYRDDSSECEDCIKEPHYKSLVHKQCIKQFADITRYDANIWYKLIIIHLYKMNYILSDNNEFPKQISSQLDIFLCQLEKYINKRCPTVAVLSAFPIFIHDYYGNAKTKEIINIEE